MHERKLCDGCGSESFSPATGFAAEVASEPVELVVWRCGGCGGETVVFDDLDPSIVDAAASRAA